jgi:hypothetical protein
MNEAGLQVENTLQELQARADPGAWARIEGYLKPGLLTGDQRIIELMVAIHPNAASIALRGQTRLRGEGKRGQATFQLHLGSSLQYREAPCLGFLADKWPDTPTMC